MNTPRRTILRGLAAAPFVAGAGGLLLPTTAHAAAARRRLTVSTKAPGGGNLTYAEVIRRLGIRADTAGQPWGIGRTSVERILAGSAQRTGVVEPLTWPAGRPPAGQTPPLHTVFRWQDDDYRTKDWRPQGITTNYDSLGGNPARTVLLVSWDAHPVRAEEQGTRVSIVDVPSGGAPRYWHVLLVEPAMKGRHPSYRPVKLHAGGLAWYRNLLYVTEFHRGASNGLRVFDLNSLFTVRWGKGHENDFGYSKDGKYYARQYGYVLPQIARYKDPARDFRYSQLALERAGDGSAPRDSLLVSEYRPKGDGRAPRLARWELGPDGRISDLTSQETSDIAGAYGIQGAVGARGTFYLSRSDGARRNGYLQTWRPGGSPTPLWQTPPGPEDLSYDRRGNVLWSLGEYAAGDQLPDEKHRTPYFTRHVYAMRLPS